MTEHCKTGGNSQNNEFVSQNNKFISHNNKFVSQNNELVSQNNGKLSQWLPYHRHYSESMGECYHCSFQINNKKKP